MADVLIYVDGEDKPLRLSGDIQGIKISLDKKYAQVRGFASSARGDVNEVIKRANTEITDEDNRKVFANLLLRSNPIDSIRKEIDSFMSHVPFKNPIEGAPEVSVGNVVKTAMEFSPVVGDVMSGAEAVDYVRQGDYGMAGLAGLGALPFVPSVAGSVAKRGPELTGKADRLSKAKESGFFVDMPLYHGTNKDIDEFKLFEGEDLTRSVSRSPVGKLGVSLAVDPKLANEFAGRAGGEGMNVMPVLHRANNPVSIDLDGTETNSEIFATVSDAWRQGFDSIKFNNYTTELGGSGQSFILVKDPNQVRSVNAKFDPSKKFSPNLLAGIAGATVVGPAVLDEDND